MPRVRTHYYDPAKLEGRSNSGGVAGVDGTVSMGTNARRTVLGRAREALDKGAQPPLSPVEALMQASPYEDPQESLLEREARLEPLRDVLDDGTLSKRELWVIEAMFFRRMSLRALALELGLSKTHVARVRDVALRKLRAALQHDGADPS